MVHASLRSIARSLVVVVGLLALGAGPLYAQDGLASAEKQKLGLRLQPVVAAMAKSGGTPGPIAPDPFRGGAGTGKAGRAPTYAVFVHTDDPDAVRGTGAAVDSRFDGFVTARATAAELRAMARLDAVEQVRASGRAQLHNDEAAAFVGARALNNGLVKGTKYTGEGVLACVIDTGIDYDHPDFVDDDGNSRIVSIWDQTVDTDGQTPYDRHSGLFSNQEAFDYGTEHDTSEIEGGGLSTQDTNGHGTHVAGTVGASGNADLAGKYKGMAPGLNYIIVKAGNGALPSTNWINGLNFCDQIAEQKGKPMVANLSLGGHAGPHDGTSEEAQAVDQVLSGGSAAGRAVVVAAGNSGNDQLHTSTSIAASTSETVGIDVPSYTPKSGAGNDRFIAQLWMDGSPDVTATLTTPDGVSLTVNPGEIIDTTTTSNGQILIGAGTDGNGHFAVQLLAVDPTSGNVPPDGTWDVQLQNNAATTVTVDGWMVDNDIGAGRQPIPYVNGDTQSTVAVPGTATHAITVGSFMHRWRWYGENGTMYRRPSGNNRSGDISLFSSEGPRRDGTGEAYKPEIAAPGQNTLSALSQDKSTSSALTVPGGMHVRKQGTSMASPVVAGSIALLLQEDPSLTSTGIKEVITQTADTDGLTGTTPNTEWGYGRLDVLEAMAQLVDPSASATHSVLANDFHPDASYEGYFKLGGDGDDAHAIRFSPSTDGRLSGAYFHLHHPSANDLTDSLVVEIRTDNGGVPGSRVGSRVKIAPSRLRTGMWNFQNLLGTDAALSAGQPYYLVYYPSTPDDALYLMGENYDASGKTLYLSSGTWQQEGSYDLLVRPVVSGLSGVQELPVGLVAFGASVSGRTATLRWETASETNNARFEVQRRRAGTEEGTVVWTTVGRVDGAGTTTTAQQYSYAVDRLGYGRHQFRLKQVDVDGTAHMSTQVTAVVTPSEGLAVRAYPNPVTTDARIAVSTGRRQDVSVAIYDVLGRRVARLHDGAVTPAQPARLRLEGLDLSSGSYFIRARGEQRTETERITVVR